MIKIKNTENVSRIVMRPTAVAKCKIGQDWYKMHFEIEFMPGDFYPDYIEVNDFVMEQIDGKELNIEEAAKILYDMLSRNYDPRSMKVTNHIVGCKTHFDVDVTIG